MNKKECIFAVSLDLSRHASTERVLAFFFGSAACTERGRARSAVGAVKKRTSLYPSTTRENANERVLFLSLKARSGKLFLLRQEKKEVGRKNTHTGWLFFLLSPLLLAVLETRSGTRFWGLARREKGLPARRFGRARGGPRIKKCNKLKKTKRARLSWLGQIPVLQSRWRRAANAWLSANAPT